MYAVIRTGGKQCRVKQGEIVRVEALEAQAGDSVTFGDVLLVGEGDAIRIGSPTVDGVSVKGTVLRQGRGKKVIIQTYKKRQNSNRRRAGHRQAFTEVKIDAIDG